MEAVITLIRHHMFLLYYVSVLAATAILFAIFYFGADRFGADNPAQIAGEQDMLSNGELMVYDDVGSLLYRAHTQQATYSPLEEYIGFAGSRMTYHTDTGRLLIDSGRGRIFDQGATVVFTDKVRLKRMSSENSVVEDMITRNLTLDIEQRVVYGEDAAEINYGKHRVTGTGVRIDLSTGKIKLLKDIKTGS